MTLAGTFPVLCGSPNTQNFNLDHNPIPPYILRAEGLEDCLQGGSTVKTTAYILDNLLSLGNWWICRVFHAHANSLSHQTSPTHLHTHCGSIKISHNSAPQHTWSSSISTPDFPYFPSPWAVQPQQVHCVLALPWAARSFFGRSPWEVDGYTGSITNSSCSLISQLLSHPFSNRWCARL